MKRTVTVKQLEFAKRLRQRGFDMRAIAERLGVNRFTLYGWFNRGEFAWDRKRPDRWSFTEKESERLFRRYEKGESVRSLSDETGIPAKTIYKNFERHGYKTKLKTGRVTDKSGYVFIHVGHDHPMSLSNGYVLEHRLVMSKILARQLEPHETVHHINGDRADNRPENLQLRQGNHGSGVIMRCRSCGSTDIESARIGATH